MSATPHYMVPDWLYEAKRHLEMAIGGTPTGPIRDKMTEANIKVMECLKDVEQLNRPKPKEA